MKTLKESVKNLEELFDLFNEKLYKGELEKPIISIQADPKNSCYGWCTTQKVWETTDGESYYEINMCAEHLTRPLEEIVATLLHEMAHLYNLMHEIKDCNASQYHNKKFKACAEEHGLLVEKTRYGWSQTTLNDEVKEIVKDLDYKFELARKPKQKGSKSKSKYKYYECPCCGVKFYSVHTINAVCEDCGVAFVQYK